MPLKKAEKLQFSDAVEIKENEKVSEEKDIELFGHLERKKSNLKKMTGDVNLQKLPSLISVGSEKKISVGSDNKNARISFLPDSNRRGSIHRPSFRLGQSPSSSPMGTGMQKVKSMGFGNRISELGRRASQLPMA